MERKMFNEFIKDKTPIKIEGDGYGFEITFDDGTSVDVGTEEEYGGAYLTFETNEEKKAQREKWDAEAKLKQEQRERFEKNKKAIMSKYTPEQWAEIEQAFLFNNGMTFQQNLEYQKQSQQFYKSLYEKYGTSSYTEFLDKLQTNNL